MGQMIGGGCLLDMEVQTLYIQYNVGQHIISMSLQAA